jgi:hypothetical protein
MSTEIPAVNFDESLTLDDSRALQIKAGDVFRPRTPISTKALFAGRWDQMKKIADAITQPGLHIVIFGERGVGKTSLANVISPVLSVLDKTRPRLVAKINTHNGDTFADLWHRVFQEISWSENKPTFGFSREAASQRVTLTEAFKISPKPSIDDVRRTLSGIPGSVFIFDEFDCGTPELRSQFTDLMKSLSDYAIDTTVVIVGVAETMDGLVRDHASIVRSVIQIHLPRMTDKELMEIIDIASKEMGVIFEPAAAKLVVATSQGLPHYTHLIGLDAARAAVGRYSRRILMEDVKSAFETCIVNAIQTIQESYQVAVRSSHKDALFKDVLLACALASSSGGHPNGEFYPSDVVRPLGVVLNRTNVTIATLQGHLAEFCENTRGPVLVKDGSPRSYRYRFTEPLLPPYVYMMALKDGRLSPGLLEELTIPPQAA